MVGRSSPKMGVAPPKHVFCVFGLKMKKIREKKTWVKKKLGLTFFRPEIVTSPIYFSVKISAWTDQNWGSPLYGAWTSLGSLGAGVNLFSAQNCYIPHLLFYCAHSVKIWARTDRNWRSRLYGAWTFFRPKIVTFPIYFYITHILWKIQPERTKIPKVPLYGCGSPGPPKRGEDGFSWTLDQRQKICGAKDLYMWEPRKFNRCPQIDPRFYLSAG